MSQNFRFVLLVLGLICIIGAYVTLFNGDLASSVAFGVVSILIVFITHPNASWWKHDDE